MIVRLQVRDAANNLSPVVENQNVRMFTQNLCGYGFEPISMSFRY
jgi:hypothetical protein